MNIKKKESLFVILAVLLTLQFLRESKKCIKLCLFLELYFYRS